MIRSRLFSPSLLASVGLLCVALRPAGAAGRVTLEQAYDRTLATDQSIRTAYYEVRKANLLPLGALTRIAPSLGVGPGFNHVAGRSTDLNLPSSLLSKSRSSTTSIDFTLSQTLIDFSVFPAFRLGKLSARSARLARQYTIRTTLFGVTSAYYEVLKQQRLVEVNRETLELAGQQLDLAEKRASVGEVTRTDVLRARVTVESARRTWIESSNQLELDRNTLRNILNFAPDAPLEVVEPPAFPTYLPPFEQLLRKANESREDLRVKNIAVDQDVERKNEVLAQYAPKLTGSAGSSFASASGTSRNRKEDWQVQLGVQVPIFTGGQREIDLVTAKYQIEQTRLDRDKTAKTVEADVKQAWLNVRTLEGTLTALRIQVAAAEQSYKDLQNQYAAGTATSVDVLSALIDLDTSRRDFAVQSYDYEVALRNLDEAAGVFQEARVVKVKIP